MIDQNLIDSLAHIALGAGSKIMPFYQKITEGTLEGTEISYKADSSPVTLADLASNHFIHTELNLFYENLPIVSEEDDKGYDVTLQHYFWLVDPLDGTREFLSGSQDFTVNIALIMNHVPIFGVIYAPALDTLYWGSELNGSYKKDYTGTKKLIHSGEPYKGPTRILASKSHMDEETQTFVRSKESYTLMQVGSSLKFCYLAEGLADIYPRFGRTCGWDTAAGHAILKFAGGHVKDLGGSELTYGKGDKFNPSFIASH